MLRASGSPACGWTLGSKLFELALDPMIGRSLSTVTLASSTLCVPSLTTSGWRLPGSQSNWAACSSFSTCGRRRARWLTTLPSSIPAVRGSQGTFCRSFPGTLRQVSRHHGGARFRPASVGEVGAKARARLQPGKARLPECMCTIATLPPCISAVRGLPTPPNRYARTTTPT